MAMVSIRARTTNGPPTPRIVLCATSIAGLVFAAACLLSAGNLDGDASVVSRSSSEGVLSPRTALTRGRGGEGLSPRTALTGPNAVAGGTGGASAHGPVALKNREELDAEDVDPLEITQGAVAALHYYHCGPLPSRDNPELTEVVLLHDSALTKEDWRSSGILDMLCEINNEEDEGNLSVIAPDLPPGRPLAVAFDALAAGGVLSGRPATFVSPAAAGAALVSLGDRAEGGGGELSRLVQAWIPVAAEAVTDAPATALQRYAAAAIPVLAVHGDQDAVGQRSTQRLTDLAGARGVELEGKHAVYLDSPEEFVTEVLQFLDAEGF